MKRQIALGVALAMALVAAPVEAQFGGLKKKAQDALTGKKAETPPTPAPTPATETPATPASAPTRAAAAPAEKKKAVPPLEMSELPVRQSADHVLRGSVNLRPNGDWDQLV